MILLNDVDPDLEREFMDPDPNPELDLNLTKIIGKISNLIVMTKKILQFNIFLEKYRYALKIHEETFKIVGIVKK
jgi:hypothetical protein